MRQTPLCNLIFEQRRRQIMGHICSMKCGEILCSFLCAKIKSVSGLWHFLFNPNISSLLLHPNIVIIVTYINSVWFLCIRYRWLCHLHYFRTYIISVRTLLYARFIICFHVNNVMCVDIFPAHVLMSPTLFLWWH